MSRIAGTFVRVLAGLSTLGCAAAEPVVAWEHRHAGRDAAVLQEGLW